jgi:hypothetical protein
MNFRREDPIYVYETLSKVIDPLGRTRRVSFGLMRHQPREWDTGPAQNVRNELTWILTFRAHRWQRSALFATTQV